MQKKVKKIGRAQQAIVNFIQSESNPVSALDVGKALYESVSQGASLPGPITDTRREGWAARILPTLVDSGHLKSLLIDGQRFYTKI